MKRWKYISLIFILTLIVASFRLVNQDAAVYQPQTYLSYQEGEYWEEKIAKYLELDTLDLKDFYGIGTIWGGSLVPDWATLYPITKEVSDGTDITYLFDEVHYKKDGVDALYPLFVAGASQEEMKSWNKIIDQDIRKILDIYSFNPLPGTKRKASAEQPTILNITYEVKAADAAKFSVLYKAAYSSKYAAHPTELVYTTNIDLKKSTRLKLSDIIILDEAFVRDFRKWDFTTYEQGNEELNQAIRDYMDGLKDSELLAGFRTADIIGAENYMCMYSYLTPGKLGISVSVANYLGDHVEFEREYEDLSEFLLPGTEHLVK